MRNPKKLRSPIAFERLRANYPHIESISAIIENRKFRAQAQANPEGVLMFWEIGKYIGSVVLGCERAGYVKKIVSMVSQQLVEKYGKSFEHTNLTMMPWYR